MISDTSLWQVFLETEFPSSVSSSTSDASALNSTESFYIQHSLDTTNTMLRLYKIWASTDTLASVWLARKAHRDILVIGRLLLLSHTVRKLFLASIRGITKVAEPNHYIGRYDSRFIQLRATYPDCGSGTPVSCYYHVRRKAPKCRLLSANIVFRCNSR